MVVEESFVFYVVGCAFPFDDVSLMFVVCVSWCLRD